MTTEQRARRIEARLSGERLDAFRERLQRFDTEGDRRAFIAAVERKMKIQPPAPRPLCTVTIPPPLPHVPGESQADYVNRIYDADPRFRGIGD